MSNFSNKRSVILISSGAKKVNVIKLVLKTTGWRLKEGKAFCDFTPSCFPLMDKEAAMQLEKDLIAVGATVEVQ